MARLGSYAKGIAKRDEILGIALEVFSRQGYDKTSLREIADIAGLSQAGLLYYFGTKEDLYVEILRKRDEFDIEAYDTGDEERSFVDIMRHNSEVPGLVKLFATLSSASTDHDHPAHQFFTDRYAAMRDRIIEDITERQEAGVIAKNLDADKIATLVLAVSDGMQLQWLYDPSKDMGDHVEYLWELVRAAGSAQ